MAVSVRMNPELEKELELAAQSKGITKSQFIIDAVEHALGRKDPYQLLLQVRAEMDLAEASLYRLAVETGVTRIMTLDGLDFARYRLPDGRQFEIL